jgi:hypothetical protein
LRDHQPRFFGASGVSSGALVAAAISGSGFGFGCDFTSGALAVSAVVIVSAPAFFARLRGFGAALAGFSATTSATGAAGCSLG